MVAGQEPSLRRAPFGRGRIAARLLGLVIDAAAAVGGRLPTRVAHALAVVGGNLEWALRPGLRRRLATNLAHALATKRGDSLTQQTARRVVVNEARRSADLLWAIARPGELLRTVQIDGIERVNEAAARGRGLLLAGIHVGGWEVTTALPGSVIPVPTTVVVADNWLAWAIEHVRIAGGLRILYRSNSGLGAIRVLQRGEALLVLGDDAFGELPRMYNVKLCGSRVLLPAGIVAMSRLSGAPIVPFDVLPLGPRKWSVQFGATIEPPHRDGGDEAERRTLQQLADHWTTIIELHPHHWAARFPIAWDRDL